MAEAAGRSGRRPDDVRLIAVSKTHPLDAVRAAADAGQLDFGENKVQEALQKIAQSTDTRLRWHLIGHLQSNKAKKAAAAVHTIHAIDSVDLLTRVDQAAAACRAVALVGLMLLPPLAENPEDARPWFARLRGLRDALGEQGVPAPRLRELSMGMSHDFEVAIEEGATMVRVGTAIFGERHYE